MKSEMLLFTMQEKSEDNEKDKAQKIERLRAIQSIKISQDAIRLMESFIPEVVNDFDSVLNYVENNIR